MAIAYEISGIDCFYDIKNKVTIIQLSINDIVIHAKYFILNMLYNVAPFFITL